MVMKRLLLTGALCAAFLCRPASAQDSLMNLAPETDYVVMELFGRSSAEVLIKALRIQRADEAPFLEVYKLFSNEKAPIAQARVALLRRYNEVFETLDEDMLNYIVKGLMKNDREFLDLHIRYYKRIAKLIGGNRAAIFFQVDNYLDQVVRIDLQKELPFINTLETEKRPAMKLADASAPR